jgi:hypothetical protein
MSRCSVRDANSDLTFTLAQLLQRHLKRDHEVTEKFNCREPLCPQLFADEPSLQVRDLRLLRR